MTFPTEWKSKSHVPNHQPDMEVSQNRGTTWHHPSWFSTFRNQRNKPSSWGYPPTNPRSSARLCDAQRQLNTPIKVKLQVHSRRWNSPPFLPAWDFFRWSFKRFFCEMGIYSIDWTCSTSQVPENGLKGLQIPCPLLSPCRGLSQGQLLTHLSNELRNVVGQDEAHAMPWRGPSRPIEAEAWKVLLFFLGLELSFRKWTWIWKIGIEPSGIVFFMMF